MRPRLHHRMRSLVVVVVSMYHQVYAVLVEERFELVSQVQYAALRHARAVHVSVHQGHQPPRRVPFLLGLVVGRWRFCGSWGLAPSPVGASHPSVPRPIELGQMSVQPRVLLAASGVVVVGRDGDEVDRRVVEPVPETVARHEEAVRIRHEMEVKLVGLVVAGDGHVGLERRERLHHAKPHVPRHLLVRRVELAVHRPLATFLQRVGKVADVDDGVDGVIVADAVDHLPAVVRDAVVPEHGQSRQHVGGGRDRGGLLYRAGGHPAGRRGIDERRRHRRRGEVGGERRGQRRRSRRRGVDPSRVGR